MFLELLEKVVTLELEFKFFFRKFMFIINIVNDYYIYFLDEIWSCVFKVLKSKINK